jgi:ribokinase
MKYKKYFDIITIGSASVDTLVKTKSEINKHENHVDIAYHLGEKVLIDNLVFTTGGGGTNCAVAFSRLGLKTGYIGAIGNDSNGKFILSDLKKEKVIFLGKVFDGNSGFSVILPGAGDRTILSYKGVNNSLDISELSLAGLNTKWLYVSTMLGMSFETSLKLIERFKNQGTSIVMNISLYLAKKGIHSLSSLLKYIDILIFNKEEAIALTSKNQIEDIFMEIRKHTDALVVITNGHEDVSAFYDGKLYLKKIEKVHPIDTTGAGDAFAAGFVYSIMRGKSIPESLDAGHKEALSVLGHIGAKNNLLRSL